MAARKTAPSKRAPKRAPKRAAAAGEPPHATDGGEEVLTTTELVELARRRLPRPAWDFIAGGAETETTTLRNRQALDAVAFRPRVLRDVEQASPAVELLGGRWRMPLVLAPLASLTEIHPEGALPIARAAARFGCPLMLSSVTQPGVEDVAKAARDNLIYQLYTDGDERWVLDAARKAVDLGVRALCLTVDVPTFGRRERGMHRRQAIAGRPFGGLRTGESHRGRADWALVARIKKRLGVPLILKGVQTAEDADEALQHGADVVYASNHGGRQLDHGRGALELLPEIVRAARGKAPVIVDGGFMRGTDALKALAMGAAMVGVGRLAALALGADGEAGVHRLLEILETELTVSMRLLGVTRCAELDGRYLQPATPMREPAALGAFPLLRGDPPGR
jgi:glycolate oxidase